MTGEYRVGVYIRVSSNEQKNEGLSLVAQENKIKQYCQFKDWKIHKLYKDEGISAGSIDKRHQFKEMLLDAKLKRFDALVILKLDRAFRNVKDSLNVLEDFDKLDVDFVSVTENIDTTTAMGRFFFIVISAFAELERKMTAERNKLIMQDKFNQGVMIGKPCYGYRIDKKTKKIVIDKIKSKIVLKCFGMASQGYSYKDICKETGLKPQSYYNVIKNKVYMGIIEFEGQEKKGTHPVLVPEELWRLAQ